MLLSVSVRLWRTVCEMGWTYGAELIHAGYACELREHVGDEDGVGDVGRKAA